MNRTRIQLQAGLRARRAGFSIVELVVAFLIIGLLTAIMVPTLSRRSEDAKLTAAQKDLEELAAALERSAIDTGYVVKVYALDDVRDGDGVNNWFPADQVDGLADLIGAGGGIYQAPTERIFISTSTQDYAPDAVQLRLIQQIVENETNFTRVTGQWNGPYINWHRDANNNDWPDDPWGNDYLFFSRQGVIRPPDLNSLPGSPLEQDESWEFFETGPDYGTGAQPNALVFDRFTVLSLGPNGLPGDGSTNTGTGTTVGPGDYGQGDDIVRKFGGG